ARHRTELTRTLARSAERSLELTIVREDADLARAAVRDRDAPLIDAHDTRDFVEVVPLARCICADHDVRLGRDTPPVPGIPRGCSALRDDDACAVMKREEIRRTCTIARGEADERDE